MVINPFQFAACPELSTAHQLFHTAFFLKWQLSSVHQEKDMLQADYVKDISPNTL
jgi:hypothetical protein